MEAGRALRAREGATLRAADFVVAISEQDRAAMYSEGLVDPPGPGGNGKIGALNWEFGHPAARVYAQRTRPGRR